MSANNSLSSRLEELRSRNPQSPQGESSYSGYNTPTRYSGSFMPSHSLSATNEARANLQRRFTTDSNTFPTLSPIGSQPTQTMDSIDMSATTTYKIQALEKKKEEYERLKEQRKKFEAELEKFNRQQAIEEKELQRMAIDLQGLNLSSGHQSEPTTPPEYRDHVFPSIYSRRNRYSSSSLVSPPSGIINTRVGRSGSQIVTPLPEPFRASATDSADKLPSKSVPGSRRGSTDRVSSYLPETGMSSQRAAAKSNRYSMPVTSSMSRKRESVPDYSSVMGIGNINTTGFLFGDDDEKPSSQRESATSPDVKSYLQMNTTDDSKFPILIRNNNHPGILSASSAALDLALSQSPGPEAQSNGWPSFSRHRHSQASLPQNIFDGQQSTQQNVETTTGTSQQPYEPTIESPTSLRQLNRRSLEATMASYGQKSGLGQGLTNGTGTGRPSLGSLQSSYSTNDIPTLKNSNGLGPTVSAPKSSAQQQFHNHNASLGRIPPHAVNNPTNNRLSRDIASESRREEPNNGFKQMQSELQASVAPFSPSMAAASTSESLMGNGIMSGPSMPQYGGPTAYYGGYGMQLMNMGMNPMQMNGPMGYTNQLSMYQTQNQFTPYAQYGQAGRFPDSQARVIQQRRLQNVEDVARFTNTKIENYQGDIYALCKDQHGCRYLQKQLEGRNPETIHIIFMETNQHVVELMTDPFGNYLCQKLLEFSNDEQRTVLINNAAPQMVKIALNQHGTRALQKMIEYISTPEQIQTIIHALKDQVVQLIQDLNGNHVIQKCLNRLTPEDAQFIFDAVGANCVVVGTHRHGCCVLQRCIDHASGYQKAQLISQITENAFSLVQDPFGNYVLQYIVDLQEPVFTNPLCYSFQTHIPQLSKQKFSSNVIEKCLRGAEASVATMMVEEMLNADELEKMLRDSFANYVVQTALDYAEPKTRERLVEAIRPILPAIRQTPYGRRIQSKILGVEGTERLSGFSTPHTLSSPVGMPSASQISAGLVPFVSQAPPVLQQFPNANNSSGYNFTTAAANNAQYTPMAPTAAPSAHAPHLSNGSSTFSNFSPAASATPASVHQPVPLYGRMGQQNGFNYF